MNFLGFGQSAEIDIIFDGSENRKTAEVKGEDGKVEKMLLYYDGESVSGKVNVTLKKPGSKLEHQGIKIEFIGQIELFYDRGNHHEFKCLAKALARPGDLIQNTSYPFDFPNVEKQFEVYSGSNVRLRYFLRVTIVRRISDVTKEVDIAVHTLCSYPDINNPIKMEVGIEDCLHIEFEYNKSKYHLKDTIIGKIYFLLVRIKIKHMEIAIIKRESTGVGPNMFTENETIAKYEIMDGAPVKGESIPIRVFLAGYNLTPTMRDINKKFSVKYFLNLVLMDTEDRRYFKQQEITLWRKADIPRYHAQQSQQLAGVVGQQHHHHPQHAPPHLVGGPSPQSNPGIHAAAGAVGMGASASASGVDSDSSTTGAVPEGKMGLFTRESPNQEFLPQADSMPTSPTSPTSPLSPLAVAAERGMGDGAAASNSSPVILSTTPPPLPVVSAAATSTTTTALNPQEIDDDVVTVDEQEEIDQTLEEKVQAATKTITTTASAVAVTVTPPAAGLLDNDDDGLTDVSLSSSATTTKESNETKKPETVAPLAAD